MEHTKRQEDMDSGTDSIEIDLWQLVLEGKVQNRQEELLEAAKQGFCR